MSASQVYRIHKVFFDFDREEDWINEMADRGLLFVGYSPLTYKFVEGEPGAYRYRFYLMENCATSYESRKYIAFMEEMGIECVGTYLRWAFFRKKAEDGAFEILTDTASRIKYVRRVLYMISAIAFANLSVGCSNVLITAVSETPFRFNSLGYINILCFLLFLPFIVKTHMNKRQLERKGSLFE